MLKKSLVIILMAFSLTTFSQNEVDVLRLSQTDIFGSARFEAMAGSFGALGADFSSIQINPAGMGRFSSNHFSFSLNHNYIENKSLYNDSVARTNENSLKLGSLGFVFAFDVSDKNNGKKYQQISYGYTRLKNFDNVRRYEGQNFNSLLDVFANDGFNITEENGDIYRYRPFSTALGLHTETIFYDYEDISYYSNLTAGDMYHDRTITTGGGIGEYHLGISENYMNQIYWGGSLGVRRVKFEQFVDHTETLLEPEDVSLNSFNYTENLNVRGLGVNLKLGFLYLPKEELRMGLSYESPTMHRLTEEYTANMIAYHDFGTLTVPSQHLYINEFRHRLKTPMKLRGSLASIFDNRGAINFDLEFVDHGRGRLRPDKSGTYGNYEFEFENEQVELQFRPVLNLRVGMEYLMTKTLFLRGGYAFLPQPFSNNVNIASSANQTFAIGFGYEKNNLSIDFGYRAFKFNSDYYAFNPSDESNKVLFESWSNNITVSLALRLR